MAEILGMDAVVAQVGFLKGAVLTVVDAAVPGPSAQNEAVKNLIRDAFGSSLNHMRSLAGLNCTMIYRDPEAELAGRRPKQK